MKAQQNSLFKPYAQKLIGIFLLSCFLVHATNTFGDGGANNRNKCNFWTKRFFAHSYVSALIPLCYASQVSCGYINPPGACCKNPDCSSNDPTCAWQQAWINGSGSKAPGVVMDRICHRGATFNNLAIDLLSALPKVQDDPAYWEKNDIGTSCIIFDSINRQVKIDSINGNMEAYDGSDVFSDFKLTVWQAHDDTTNHIQDTTYDEGEIIWQGIVHILNGTLTSTGFDAGNYAAYTDNGYTGVNFTNLTVVVNVPDDVDMHDLTFTIESDGGGSSGSVVNKALSVSEQKNKSDKSLKVGINPIPANNFLNVNIYSEVESSADFKLYDESGRLITEISNKHLNSRANTDVRIDVEKLPNGNYFLMTKISNQNYRINKFVVEK